MDSNWMSGVSDEDLYLLDGTEDILNEWVPSTSDVFQPFKYPETQELSQFISTEVIPNVPFNILSTIRYDPSLISEEDYRKSAAEGEIPADCFFLLKLHHQRLQYTADFFHWNIVVPYDHLLKELRLALQSLDPLRSYKMRVLVSKEGDMTVEASEVPLRSNLFSGLSRHVESDDPHYTVYLDKDSIMVGPFTSFKTTHREVYNQSRTRTLKANDPKYQEVLLYNPRDELTEGSITNIALFRDGGWKTPPLGVGCLCGVMRHHLLAKKVLQEATIYKKSLKSGEPILIFNGIMGVCRGTLKLESSDE